MPNALPLPDGLVPRNEAKRCDSTGVAKEWNAGQCMLASIPEALILVKIPILKIWVMNWTPAALGGATWIHGPYGT